MASDTHQWTIQIDGEPPETPWGIIGAIVAVVGVATGIYLWRKK